MNLSQRDISVLEAFADGYDYYAIAHKLQVTPAVVIETARKYRKKTNAKNTVEMIAKAIREGWIK